MAYYEAIRTSRNSQSENGADAQVTSPLLSLHRDNSRTAVELRSDRDSHLRAADLVSDPYVEEYYGTSTTGSSHRRSGNTASTRHAGETAPTSYPPSSRGEQKRKRASSSPSSLYVNHYSSDESGSSGRETQMRTNVSSMGTHMPNRYSPKGQRRVEIRYTADAGRIDPSRNAARASQRVTRSNSAASTIDPETASTRSDKQSTERLLWETTHKVVFSIIVAALSTSLAIVASGMCLTHDKDLWAIKTIFCAVHLGCILALTVSAYSGQSLHVSIDRCVASCVLTSLVGGSLFVAFRDVD